jgi:hypothetical protein
MGLLAFSALAFGFIGSTIAAAQTAGNLLGIFENQSDVDSVTPPGTASFDAATGVYILPRRLRKDAAVQRERPGVPVLLERR